MSRATQLIDALEKSVGGQVDIYTRIAIEEQAQDILDLQKKTKRLKKQLLELAKETLSEDIELVCSIPGIAADTAVGILMELEDINRFEKASNVAAFWGINPTIKQSGDCTFYMGMSKAGSPSARAILYMAAENTIRHNAYFKAIYAKQRAKGKKHRSALGVVMSKLARVIYGILKNRTKFDSGVDVYNQNKKPEKQKTNCSTINKKHRRYQDVNEAAPVSSRQKKLRKQEVVPQIE